MKPTTNVPTLEVVITRNNESTAPSTAWMVERVTAAVINLFLVAGKAT